MSNTTAKRERRRGVLITFEGIEGSGKSTQCARLAKRLREGGYGVVETREPGGTPIAERIRTLLLELPSVNAGDAVPSATEPLTPECEAMLIFAARSQHVMEVIEPALSRGVVVLCDRFSDSTLAYQGYARGLNRGDLRRLNRFATKGLTPDLTVLLDLPVTVGLARRRRHGMAQNRLDQETRRFHDRVRKGFLKLVERHPRRIRWLDARADPDTVAEQTATLVQAFLRKHHLKG